MKNRFYLASFRDSFGGNISWHCHAGAGYHTDVRKAQVFTREKAQQAWENGRNFDQPISADHVDACLIWKVDCQHIPSATTLKNESCKYVGYLKGQWAGNDVYWLTNQARSLDFDQAALYDHEQVLTMIEDDTLIFIPHDLAEKVKRPTFEQSELNKRVMIQGAGLTMPKKVKLAKRRKPNPKTRMNCPSCGKIHWQHNPYDFEGCNDESCEEHKLY